MKTSVEITLKSLALSGIPEKALLISRNLLTVEMIWPKTGTPRKSASRQVTMKKGKVDFTVEPCPCSMASTQIMEFSFLCLERRPELGLLSPFES